MKFDEIKEDVRESKYIVPGVHEPVVILGFEKPEDKNYFTVKFGYMLQELNTNWYISQERKAEDKPTALEVSLKKAKHLGIEVLTDEEKSTITSDTELGLLETILKKCVGRKLRMKFIGEEFLREDGSIGVRTKIGFAPFAEKLDKPCSLRFDLNNAYDYKKIPIKVVVEDKSNPFM